MRVIVEKIYSHEKIKRLKFPYNLLRRLFKIEIKDYMYGPWEDL